MSERASPGMAGGGEDAHGHQDPEDGGGEDAHGQLGDPSSPVAQAIDGSAQVIVAAIDHVLRDHAAESSA
jgi:hypothetical protein